MIEYVNGNLLEADAQALVNTVNCVGVMGAGIALQFKHEYPENCKFYERACRGNQVTIGSMLIWPTGNASNPQFIINFPTKQHWKNPSELEWIESGLDSLESAIGLYSIKSIAVPALGCSNGKLDWNDVRPLIERAFKKMPDVRALVYPPQVRR